MQKLKAILVLLVSATFAGAADTSGSTFDQTVDRVVEQERKFVTTMKDMHPLAETYIQNLHPSADHESKPVGDQYFLGRVVLNNALHEPLFKKQHGESWNPFTSVFAEKALPQGFAQMMFIDPDFQKSNYRFTFVRREFLGEVRCVVIDVQPKDGARLGLFTGRIWVEDRDFDIVRFNGIYAGSSRYKYYLHFDSWRFNLQSGVWLPSYIYVEESATQPGNPLSHEVYFKAQTRLWSYDPKQLNHEDEFTQIRVDSSVEDRSIHQDNGPVQAQRMWERMAEDNALDRLQKTGLIAPAGDVDKVLETVANNILISNKLEIEPEVRCRVLLTMPLESFTIGHTIVISHGLLDVLPDEASLATIIAHELGHIVLGHHVDTRFAFNDRFFFPDTETFRRLDFERKPADEQAADKKGTELLMNSVYKDKLSGAGLFLAALRQRSTILPNLIRAEMGNSMTNGKNLRMAGLVNSAPALGERNIDQIAALPIGSRIKLDPWSNQITMMNVAHANSLSEAEKMPFEVTPFFPSLSYSQADRKLVAENPAK